MHSSLRCSRAARLLLLSATAVALFSALAASGLAPVAAAQEGAPHDESAPAITGAAVEHGRLKAERGSWSGAAPLRYAENWARCNSSGGECEAIAGADKATYRPVRADVGHRLTVTVVASNKDGTGEATSAPSAVVANAAPKKRRPATISGEAVDGRVLTVSEGTWKGTAPFTFTYQWLRCAGRNCEEIADATEKSYRAQTADIGKKLRALVTAHNAAGQATSRSKPSAKVVPGSPLNLVRPTIEGSPLPGQTLTAHDGTWVGTPPIAYSYQWLRCSSLGGGCTEIPGATEQTYMVTTEEIGDAFEVTVTATNAEGKAAATSPETSVTGGGVTAPEDLVPPSIVGLAVTGQELTATEGTWKGTEPSYSYQWELCSSSGSECGKITGATSNKFKIPDGDAGHELRVTVTASNAAGEASASSRPTTEVLGVSPTNTEAPSISGEAKEGQLLTASSGKWSGTEPIAYEYEWLRCNASGGECSTAQAASALPTYLVAAADATHKLRVRVIATNVAGKGEAESEPSATVAGTAPENHVAPLILGLAVTGQELSASEGTWTGTEPITYAYQWQLCSKAGGECANIEKATSSKYTIPDGDAGHTLRVLVTASNAAGKAEKESTTTTEVLGQAPSNTEAPSITGEADEGQLLTASSGKWSGTEPIAYEYEWLRCNTEGKSCTQAAAPSLLPTYTVAAADVGKTLVAKVIAKNIAGKGEAQSKATATVKGVVPTNATPPVTLPAGTTTSGSTVTVTSEGVWTGTQPIAYEYEWKLCTSSTACKVEQKGASKEYKLPAGSSGKKLRVNVIATNAAGKAEKEALELTILI